MRLAKNRFSNVSLGVLCLKCVLPLGVLTLGILTLGVLTLGVLTLGILTLGVLTLGVLTLGILTLGTLYPISFFDWQLFGMFFLYCL